MRTLLTGLAAIVIGATAFTGYTMATGRAVTNPVVDPTVTYGYVTPVPAGVDCGSWRYGVVTVHGVRTIDQDGCIDPIAPLADGFVGLLPSMMRDASHN